MRNSITRRACQETRVSYRVLDVGRHVAEGVSVCQEGWASWVENVRRSESEHILQSQRFSMKEWRKKKKT